jgi:uncharacterized protein YjbI with pentapeptide repeats
MDPTVVAAVIAAAVSGLTLVGTLAAQYFGRRGTSRDTKEALQEQWKQLERNLAEQRTRNLNERFATAADQLGSDKPAAVRLAGVYAMAGLANDWEANRQTCVDVLCAYLRMPYEPDPGKESSIQEQLAFKSSREVRHTVIRVIAAHLKDSAVVSWQGLNFDFTGVVFDGGSFDEARFSGGTVDFGNAQFTDGTVSFHRVKFTGSTVSFDDTQFSGGTVSFNSAEFSGGKVTFVDARFIAALVTFGDAMFSGGTVTFDDAQFTGGMASFNRVRFTGGTVSFGGTHLTFGDAHFTFGGARFSGGDVTFDDAVFSGGTVTLEDAEFSGGTVDFSNVSDWSHPPTFPWTDTPPSGVQLPPPGAA